MAPIKETPSDKKTAKKTVSRVEAAPAKKKSVKKARTAMTIALPRGIELTMVPIPRKNYWMGKVPVTQAQWRAVMGRNPSEHKGAENPVESITWNACQKFLGKLNALPSVQASGLVFRLPTEEEWVFAAHAGGMGDYCKLADGTEITDETFGEVAWFSDNSDETVHPVGQKKPNAFGLYDMLGNVIEWTATTSDDEYTILLGGCWLNSAGDCVPSAWDEVPRNYRSDEIGFRLCADRRAD